MNSSTASGGKKLSSQLSLSKDEEEVTQSDDNNNDHHHPNLYIPGVVYVGYEPWKDNSASTLKEADGDEKAEALKKQQQEALNQQSESLVNRSDSTSGSSAAANSMVRRRQMKWITTDGTSDVLRFLEMDASSRMFMDHTTTSYYELLDMEYEF